MRADGYAVLILMLLPRCGILAGYMTMPEVLQILWDSNVIQLLVTGG
jgi:Flp pilus assembly protein TadB